VADVLNPVEIEQHIRELVERIAKGVSYCDKCYRDMQAKERDYDRAFIGNYMVAEGAVKDRELQAKMQAMEERTAFEEAEAKYRHAAQLHKALDSELRAYQSIGASVRMMYGNVGRGEP
jgi:hypothetical protein